MGPEINIDSILALERQTKEGTGDVIHLKRFRNSLLNISTRIPPEILGHIFRWSVIPKKEFGGLRKGSYNFLLVCHYWFEVASSTPELWNFWGNTLEQWSQRYQRSGSIPLDLALNAPHHTRDGGTNAIPFDGPLRDALQDRAARDSIRSVHLQGRTDLLQPVISSLTLDSKGIRCNSIESLILVHYGLDISNFLSCYRFPKLRTLRLATGAKISDWGHLKLQATSLTTLSLEYRATSNGPTASQLLSILASYPNLQDLSLLETLGGTTSSRDIGDESTFRVPLCRLKRLHLVGECRHVFRLLERLKYPDTLDDVDLKLLECVAGGISEFLPPYLQDRIRRDDRFQSRLGIRVSSAPNSASFNVSVRRGEFNTPTISSGWHSHPSISFRASFRDPLPRGVGEKLCTDLITLTSRVHVVDLTVGLSTRAMRDLVVTMPNIEDLYLVGPAVSNVFPRSDSPSRAKLLPSLRHLHLGYFNPQNYDDWDPLIAYLAHRKSGGKAISLRLWGGGPIPLGVQAEIEDLVKVLYLGNETTHDT